MMKRISTVGATRKTIIDSPIEKSLLRLHGTIDIESFWEGCPAGDRSGATGLLRRHDATAQSDSPNDRPVDTADIRRPFHSKPLEAYLAAHPRSKLCGLAMFFRREAR